MVDFICKSRDERESNENYKMKKIVRIVEFEPGNFPLSDRANYCATKSDIK